MTSRKNPTREQLAAPASPGLQKFVAFLDPGDYNAVRLWNLWNWFAKFDDPCEENQMLFRHRLKRAGMIEIGTFRLRKSVAVDGDRPA